MVRVTGWATCVALAVLACGAPARAQIVHKCIVNGAAVFQAADCPPASERKTQVIPPAPSQQELLDATANGRLQGVQPGTIPPAPTTWRRRNQASSTGLTSSRQAAEEAPATDCDRLNQTYRDAQYRRDELSAPGAGATRSAALQRALDDMRRAQDLAANTQCRLR